MTAMKCLHDNVVLIRGENQTERKGILLPDSAQEESNTGEVICVGPDVKDIKVGDTVLVPLLTFMRVMSTKQVDLFIDGKPALVVKEEDIAVVWPRTAISAVQAAAHSTGNHAQRSSVRSCTPSQRTRRNLPARSGHERNSSFWTSPTLRSKEGRYRTSWNN